MGIVVEFNPDLALRDYSEFEKGNRKEEECIPKNLEAGKVFDFLKKDQRNYWLFGEIPLRETKGNQVLGKPIASVIILEATHFLEGKEMFTRGKYKVVDVFDPNDKTPKFDGLDRIK
ncbi:MAG: hypothetical protein QF506_04750 [Candidatus Woesearchaeota archaeon]|jgi:hypothetical protein|nr:hypothetical protein [Candidatus Woesearchaeota archaeon]|tara:strand:- start:3139 stop:3489 length:351 start_codon:yes stop_codon:yes gene_type:complete